MPARKKRAVLRHKREDSDDTIVDVPVTPPKEDGDRPFDCPTCGQAFKRKVDQRQHMETHNENKRPYLCNLCPASYAAERSRMRHFVRVHVEDKPYECRSEDCDATFSRNFLRNEHERQHHEALQADDADDESPKRVVQPIHSKKNAREAEKAELDSDVEIIPLESYQRMALSQRFVSIEYPNGTQAMAFTPFILWRTTEDMPDWQYLVDCLAVRKIPFVEHRHVLKSPRRYVINPVTLREEIFFLLQQPQQTQLIWKIALRPSSRAESKADISMGQLQSMPPPVTPTRAESRPRFGRRFNFQNKPRNTSPSRINNATQAKNESQVGQITPAMHTPPGMTQMPVTHTPRAMSAARTMIGLREMNEPYPPQPSRNMVVPHYMNARRTVSAPLFQSDNDITSNPTNRKRAAAFSEQTTEGQSSLHGQLQVSNGGTARVMFYAVPPLGSFDTSSPRHYRASDFNAGHSGLADPFPLLQESDDPFMGAAQPSCDLRTRVLPTGSPIRTTDPMEIDYGCQPAMIPSEPLPEHDEISELRMAAYDYRPMQYSTPTHNPVGRFAATQDVSRSCSNIAVPYFESSSFDNLGFGPPQASPSAHNARRFSIGGYGPPRLPPFCALGVRPLGGGTNAFGQGMQASGLKLEPIDEDYNMT